MMCCCFFVVVVIVDLYNVAHCKNRRVNCSNLAFVSDSFNYYSVTVYGMYTMNDSVNAWVLCIELSLGTDMLCHFDCPLCYSLVPS